MDALDHLAMASTNLSSDIVEEGDFHTKTARYRTIRVASIDGGGTRGIIPAFMLAEIEKILNLPIAEVFDLIAGTSTGAIIATALNIPQALGSTQPLYTANQIVELFEKESTTVFPHSYLAWAYEPFTAKYSNAGLYTVLKKYCQDFRLSQSLKDILIPAAEVSPDSYYKPWFFTKKGALPYYKDQEKHLINLDKIPAWEIVAASASAPTYFPSKVITFGEATYQFMDGGTFVNNPARNALTYSQRIFDSAAPHILASFGTGFCPAPRPNSWFENGFLYWGANFPTAALSLTAESVIADLHLEFPDWGAKQSLFVMQPTIEAKDYTLDDTSATHLAALKDYAKAYIDEHQAEIDLLCKKLEHEQHIEQST